MTIDDNVRELLELAKGHFDDFGAEGADVDSRFFTAVAKGEIANYGDPDPNNNDSTDTGNWGPERTLRANRIEWLCSSPDAARYIHHHGIQAQGAIIRGRLDLSAVRTELRLGLFYCRLDDEIDFTMASFSAINFRGSCCNGIIADSVKVQAGLYLRDDFNSTGEIRLVGATIGGILDLSGATLFNGNGVTLSADSASIGGSVYLRDGFSSTGEIRLLGANIRGALDFTKARLLNENHVALRGTSISVGGDVGFYDGFESRGILRLSAAKVAGQLLFRNSRLASSSGSALELEAATIAGSVGFLPNVEIDGEVCMRGAHVGGDLTLRGITNPHTLKLNLQQLRIRALRDEIGSWPESKKLNLHGFTYEILGDQSPVDAESRINWLGRDAAEPFNPQPYEQLASVLARQGHRLDAREIRVEKERRIAESIPKENWKWRCLTWVWGISTDYGYRPWKVWLPCLLIILIGAFFYEWTFRIGRITPTRVQPNMEMFDSNDNMKEYPTFQSLMYSIDALIPLVNLDQTDYWLPNAHRGPRLKLFGRYFISWGGCMLFFYHLQVIAGWVFTTLIVLGLTGLVRQDE